MKPTRSIYGQIALDEHAHKGFGIRDANGKGHLLSFFAMGTEQSTFNHIYSYVSILAYQLITPAAHKQSKAAPSIKFGRREPGGLLG